MGLFKKKQKEEPQPQYYMSVTNEVTYNYNVYYLSGKEKVVYFLIAFVIGAAVGYLFYGGIGKDDLDQPTLLTYILDVLISCTIGLIAGKVFLPIRAKQIKEKKQRQLKEQFRDMLEALTTSLGAGKNVTDSFNAVKEDLSVQYEEDAYILQELSIILAGVNNNVDLEDMLEDFGRRSGIPDIESFANVFRVCYRKGGNIKDTIRSTHEILSDKMAIAEDIETVVTAGKNEQNIMLVMPVILIGMIKMLSSDFARNFTTPTGIISTTFAIGLFVAAYFIGKVVLDIKI